MDDPKTVRQNSGQFPSSSVSTESKASQTTNSMPIPIFLDAPQSPEEMGRLGHYRILEVIGQGGMGMVFKAEDTRLKRLVAIKVLLPEVAANPVSKSRFMREARAQAAVEHDHIIPIFSVEEHGNTPFLTMPLLVGESLSAALKRTPRLPLNECVRIGREIAEGLAAAHDQGLVHRDIKPGNIWLDARKRRVRILDFGLARGTQGTANEPMTLSGAVMGTPGYMSPEQAAGKVVDFRSDIFSFGVLLYLLTTADMPFHGNDLMSLLTALVIEVPVSPLELNSAIPPGLSQCIEKCIAKDPDQRPQSMHEVVTLLSQYDPTASEAPSSPDTSLSNPFFDIEQTEKLSSVSRIREMPKPAAPLWIWLLMGLGVLVVGGGVLAMVLLKQTPGVLIVDGDSEVELLLKSKARADIRVKGRESVIPAGDYSVEIAERKPGLRVSPRDIKIVSGSTATVRLLNEMPPRVTNPKPTSPQFPPMELVRKPAITVHEVHGASPTALDAWAKKLPKGYRPCWVSVRAGSESPLLDAVAERSPDNSEWDLQVILGEHAPKYEEMRMTHRPAWMQEFRTNPLGSARLWIKDSPFWLCWYGNGDFIASKLMEGKADGNRPYSLGMYQHAHGPNYELLFGPNPGVDYEWQLNISHDDLITEIQSYRKKGWRPHIINIQGNVMPPRYNAIFTANEPFLYWDFSPALTLAQYESSLKENASRGYRPQCVCSNEVNGNVNYLVVWSTEADRGTPTQPGEKIELPVVGLGSDRSLSAVSFPPGWIKADCFAEVKGTGTLTFPALESTSFVLDLEVEMRGPGLASIQLGDAEGTCSLRLSRPLGDETIVDLIRKQGDMSFHPLPRSLKEANLRLKMLVDDKGVLLLNGDEVLLRSPITPKGILKIDGLQMTSAVILRKAVARSFTEKEKAEYRKTWILGSPVEEAVRP